jgi:PAS domain S-box-containing protein
MSNPPKMVGYGVAFLSVIAAIIILQASDKDLRCDAPHVSVFLCAVIFSTWFGGTRPGLLAVVLSVVAFDYYFLLPVYSFVVEHTQYSRLLLFMVPAFFIVWFSAGHRTVTESLRQSNTALHEEITERKYAEEKLHTKEQEFRAIVENTPDHIMRFDRGFRPKYVNPAVARMYGKPAEALTGKTIGELAGDLGLDIDEAEMGVLLHRIKTVFDTGKPCQFEISWPSPGGRMYYSVGFFPEFDSNDSVINVLAISRDITERMKAEDALRRSEDRTRLIIDTIPTMAWSMGADGVLDFVNKRWLDYAGIALEEEIEDPTQIIHPEDLPGVMESWKTNMGAGKSSEEEIRLRRADGVYRWFLVRTAPLHDEQGKLVKWYGVSIDIEESRRLNNALRESEQRYLSLFENMTEGVAYFQMLFKDGELEDAIYLEVNTAWEKLTGLHNVIGRRISEVIPGSVDTNSEFFQRAIRVSLTGQPERFEAYSTYLKKWVSTSAYSPKKEQVIAVIDDITERKQAEETLQQSYKEIRQLTEHLQNIREDERKNVAREIHDELGQQLTAIKMDVAWIDKKTPEATVEIKAKLKNIIALLNESNQSVRRILSELRPKILDDHGLLEAVEWLGREFSKATGIPVTFVATEKDINVSEQIATCIFRVCQEAFTNITRHSHATHVLNSISIIEENIVVTMEDNGVGFDATSIQNKKSFGILGMKERVGSLGGKFDLVASVGKGTSIKVSLPYHT